MAVSHEPRDSGKHLLGPHVVGQRVVVRRLLRGQVGPTGGPAFIDLLGTCLSWIDGVCVIAPEQGEPVAIAVADIVSGKPVPPRPSVRLRATPAETHRRASALFPQQRTQQLGAWLLRIDTESARRSNSCLAIGSPELPLDQAAAAVIDFYVGHGRRPVAAVVSGSPEDEALTGLGWVPESAEADTSMQVTGVASALRSARGLRVPAASSALGADGLLVARTEVGATGLASCDGEWLGIRAVEVPPSARGARHGLAVVLELLDWGAEQGARTAFLQVHADNAAALRLYEGLGFVEHHRYRYLCPPGVE